MRLLLFFLFVYSLPAPAADSCADLQQKAGALAKLNPNANTKAEIEKKFLLVDSLSLSIGKALKAGVMPSHKDFPCVVRALISSRPYDGRHNILSENYSLWRKNQVEIISYLNAQKKSGILSERDSVSLVRAFEAVDTEISVGNKPGAGR